MHYIIVSALCAALLYFLLKPRIQPASVSSKVSDTTSKKPKIVSDWERENKQTWPVYDNYVVDEEENVIRVPGQPLDIFFIIPLDRGGPEEWWNIHPMPVYVDPPEFPSMDDEQSINPQN